MASISWKIVLLLAGAAAIVIRLLLDSDFGQSTLLYILVPFVLSLLIAFFTRNTERTSVAARYVNNLRISTIVFLATSAFLMEGFICVLMFMPIYYVFVTIGFIFAALMEDKKDENDEEQERSKLRVAVIPLLVLVLVSEGLFPETTFERDNTATFVADSPLSVAALQNNMAQPIAFDSERHWFMQLFPMPDRVDAGSLGEGDIHKVHFTYRRWFFTNIHQGEIHLKIARVAPDHVRTKVIRNDSYLANYMEIDGTDIRFSPKPDGGTRVALTVRYTRSLDPVWYFGPMQQFAAKQSAKQFLQDIIFRHAVKEVKDGT
ncbi:hypothetical protein [Alterisphingorhabdus coralli]|uniref:SRPBCC family protein n=1 Tax=Alterisphingorhabdus coralli TaxID=3071408 RepID=A0AA97I1H5_9SPHN|nr:hypothetical protein [Parasphingorhabdus sp. SCSIO 66989]WOE75300.1 hypothetical protein RB602_00865 [Parasphingorhabdus sp. SCSIO 66989]